jgi:GNAT superfamily N-acetyltransferase
MDGSTWRRYRLLTGRGTEPPFFLEPDNPDDWPGHFTLAGFTPLARYFSSVNPDIAGRRPPAEPTPSGVVLRELDPLRVESEMSRLWRVAATGFAGNFLYSPIEEDEFREIYGPVMPLARPELVQFAEVDGQPVGFCFALADLLQGRRGQAVDTVVVKSLAVLPEHRRRRLGSVLIGSVVSRARTLGFRRAIFALMHEDNPSRRLEREVMRDFRQYTLFARTL